MTISTTTNQILYTGDGFSTQFSFPYPFTTPTDLKVYIDGALPSIGFSVSGNAPSDGSGTFASGTVIFVSPVPALSNILIYCDPDQLQSTRLPANDPFPSKTVERMIDKLTLLVQRVSNRFVNALTFPIGETGTSGVLPTAVLRANYLLGFNAQGNPVAVAPVSGSAADVIADLANSTSITKGDAMVAVQAPYINSLPMTQHAINNTRVSLLSFLPITEHDAIRNETSILDVTSGVNKAFGDMRLIDVPRGRYIVNSQMLIEHRVNVRGDGMNLSKFVSGVTGATDAMLIRPLTGGGGDYTFYDLSGFSIEPAAAGNGRNGIRITTDATTYFSNFDISRLNIGDFGDYAMCLNNAPASANAFFRGAVRGCWLQNGLKGVSIGDTLQFSENTITGTRLTTPGLNLSGLQGARQVVVYLNNITTQSGAIELFNMEQPKLFDNQCEHPGYVGNYTGGLASQVYLGNVYAAEIRGNTIGPGNITYPAITPADTALLLDGTCIENKIYANVIQQGRLYHVGFNSASCQWNDLRKDNSYGYPGTLSLFDNSGALPNFGVPKVVPLSNSWVSFDGTSTPTAEIIEGVLFVRGQVKSGTVTAGTVIGTLPLGMRHTTQTKSFPVATFNGTAWLNATVTVGTDGTIRVASMTAGYNSLVSLDSISFRMD